MEKLCRTSRKSGAGGPETRKTTTGSSARIEEGLEEWAADLGREESSVDAR